MSISLKLLVGVLDADGYTFIASKITNKMAKKEETSSTAEGIKADDAIFMAECLKHLQTPANVRALLPQLFLYLRGMEKNINKT